MYAIMHCNCCHMPCFGRLACPQPYAAHFYPKAASLTDATCSATICLTETIERCCLDASSDNLIGRHANVCVCVHHQQICTGKQRLIDAIWSSPIIHCYSCCKEACMSAARLPPCIIHHSMMQECMRFGYGCSHTSQKSSEGPADCSSPI